MFERLIDRALARGLAQSPRAAQLCTQLAGRTLVLHVAGVPATLVLHSSGSALTLRRAGAEHGDASVSGGALGLLALSGTEAEEVIRRGDVRIDGDAQVAQQFRELARLLRPNLEALAAELVGPVPAHLLARTTHGALGWARQTARTALSNVAEYLAHESRDLVPRAEAEELFSGIEALRDQLDRLDARLQHLEHHSAQLRGAGE